MASNGRPSEGSPRMVRGKNLVQGRENMKPTVQGIVGENYPTLLTEPRPFVYNSKGGRLVGERCRALLIQRKTFCV